MLQSCGLADRFDFALTWERHMNYNLEAGRDIEASTPKFPVHNRTGGEAPESPPSQLVWGSLGVPSRHSVSPRQCEPTMHTRGGRGSWSGDRLCSCRTAARTTF